MHQQTETTAYSARTEHEDMVNGEVPKILARGVEVLAPEQTEDVKCDGTGTGADRTSRIKEHDSHIKHITTPYCRRRMCLVCSCSYTVGLVLGTALLALFLLRSKAPPFSIDTFAERHIPLYSLEEAARNKSSPQAKALKFISDKSPASYPFHRLEQRYALAVFYYSTSSVVDDDFDEDECNWFLNSDAQMILQDRLVCDDEKRYLSLVIAGNAFDGTIPSEVEMLTSLQYINLQRSSMHGTVPPQL
jgi:hypothetical protein